MRIRLCGRRWAELARAGGASSTFDLLLHTQGGGRTEFCQIDRSELGALQGYLQRSRIKVGGVGGGGGKRQGVMCEGVSEGVHVCLCMRGEEGGDMCAVLWVWVVWVCCVGVLCEWCPIAPSKSSTWSALTKHP